MIGVNRFSPHSKIKTILIKTGLSAYRNHINVSHYIVLEGQSELILFFLVIYVFSDLSFYFKNQPKLVSW